MVAAMAARLGAPVANGFKRCNGNPTVGPKTATERGINAEWQ